LTLLLLSLAGGIAASTADPLTGLLALRRAERRRVEGAFTAAERDYQTALHELPHAVQPALRLAALYRVWGYPERGLTLLDEASRRGAAEEETLALRMALLREARNWETLSATAQTRLDAAPNDIDALAALTTAHLHQYRCDAAQASARAWHTAAPEDPAGRRVWQALTTDAQMLDVGEALLKAGEPALAACVLDRAVTHAPTDARAHAWLGHALSALGRPNAARRHLTQATELAPNEPLGWLLLGLYELQHQNPGAARRALFNAHELDPNNPAPCLAMADTFAAEGHYAKSEPWLEAALARAPDDPEVHKSIAHFYLERHLPDQAAALEAAARAVELAPDDPEAHRLLGQILLAKRETTQALSHLETAVMLAPDYAEAHYVRGQALSARGETDAAQQAFTRAADLGYRP
jgi:tetratricopeptide (TPR) repeat protein